MFTHYSELSNVLYTDADLKIMGITVTTPQEELQRRKLFRLKYTEKPAVTKYQRVEEVIPDLVDGEYAHKYVVRDMFTEDYVDSETGETVTVEQQKQRYDEQLAREAQYYVNVEARAYLASTDWYAVRKSETGVDIPSDILEKRAEARAAIVEL